MRVHVETLFRCDGAGRLVQVNVPNGGPAPRFFLGRTIHANDCWFRQSLADDLVVDLRSLCNAEQVGELRAKPDQAQPFLARLSVDESVSRIWAGPTFSFPDAAIGHADGIAVTSENGAVLSPYLDAWHADVAARVPMAAVLEHGQAVSVCCSVRIGDAAHEAGVETHPDFRGRGHANAAVRAWAALVRQVHRIPLYSTSWDNLASCALAKRVGLQQYGASLHLT